MVREIIPIGALEAMTEASNLLIQLNDTVEKLKTIGIDFTEHVHPEGKDPLAEFNLKFSTLLNKSPNA
jgi:hypothetical protein